MNTLDDLDKLLDMNSKGEIKSTIDEVNMEESNKIMKSELINDNLTLINNQQDFNQLSYKIFTFLDDKERDKFTKNCEKLIRNSWEYKIWIEYVRYTLNCNKCILTQEEITEVSIHIHHHPINLFTITYAVIGKFMEEQKPFSSLEIADEVMKVHFSSIVGIVALCSTMHEKFHNGCVDIDIKDVTGEWASFFNEYSKYMTSDMINGITELSKINKSTSYFRVENNTPPPDEIG